MVYKLCVMVMLHTFSSSLTSMSKEDQTYHSLVTYQTIPQSPTLAKDTFPQVTLCIELGTHTNVNHPIAALYPHSTVMGLFSDFGGQIPYSRRRSKYQQTTYKIIHTHVSWTVAQ